MNDINVIVENLKQTLYECICSHEVAPAWFYHVQYHDGSNSNLSEFLTLTKAEYLTLLGACGFLCNGPQLNLKKKAFENFLGFYGLNTIERLTTTQRKIQDKRTKYVYILLGSFNENHEKYDVVKQFQLHNQRKHERETRSNLLIGPRQLTTLASMPDSELTSPTDLRAKMKYLIESYNEWMEYEQIEEEMMNNDNVTIIQSAGIPSPPAPPAVNVDVNLNEEGNNNSVSSQNLRVPQVSTQSSFKNYGKKSLLEFIQKMIPEIKIKKWARKQHIKQEGYRTFDNIVKEEKEEYESWIAENLIRTLANKYPDKFI
jgi:hypothetical protein